MTLVSFLWWREEVKCDFLLFSLLFHVHLSQPLQSSERSGGGHVAWRPGPILSPVFQIMDGHNCHINIARPGVAATSQFSSRGLTHARHLGKEPRRSLWRSVQGMWDVRQPGSRGTRHCPGDRSQLSQDPGPAAGSQVADPGQTSARHRHGRMPQKYAANNFHNLSQNFWLWSILLLKFCQEGTDGSLLDIFLRCKPEFLEMFSVLVIRYFRYDVTIRQWLHQCCCTTRPGL